MAFVRRKFTITSQSAGSGPGPSPVMHVVCAPIILFEKYEYIYFARGIPSVSTLTTACLFWKLRGAFTASAEQAWVEIWMLWPSAVVTLRLLIITRSLPLQKVLPAVYTVIELLLDTEMIYL